MSQLVKSGPSGYSCSGGPWSRPDLVSRVMRQVSSDGLRSGVVAARSGFDGEMTLGYPARLSICEVVRAQFGVRQGDPNLSPSGRVRRGRGLTQAFGRSCIDSRWTRQALRASLTIRPTPAGSFPKEPLAVHRGAP